MHCYSPQEAKQIRNKGQHFSETPLIWTFLKAPLVSVLTEFDFTFTVTSRVELFVSWSVISTTWAEVIIRVKRGVYCLWRVTGYVVN